MDEEGREPELQGRTGEWEELETREPSWRLWQVIYLNPNWRGGYCHYNPWRTCKLHMVALNLGPSGYEATVLETTPSCWPSNGNKYDYIIKEIYERYRLYIGHCLLRVQVYTWPESKLWESKKVWNVKKCYLSFHTDAYFTLRKVWWENTVDELFPEGLLIFS